MTGVLDMVKTKRRALTLRGSSELSVLLSSQWALQFTDLITTTLVLYNVACSNGTPDTFLTYQIGPA